MSLVFFPQKEDKFSIRCHMDKLITSHVHSVVIPAHMLAASFDEDSQMNKN